MVSFHQTNKSTSKDSWYNVFTAWHVVVKVCIYCYRLEMDVLEMKYMGVARYLESKFKLNSIMDMLSSQM